MLNVLVIDDTELCGEITVEKISCVLKQMGIDAKIQFFCNPLAIHDDAVENAEIAVVDYNMPCMKGDELITKMLDINSNIKIFGCTSEKEYAESIMINAGAVKVLDKAFTVEDVQCMIGCALGNIQAK